MDARAVDCVYTFTVYERGAGRRVVLDTARSSDGFACREGGVAGAGRWGGR